MLQNKSQGCHFEPPSWVQCFVFQLYFIFSYFSSYCFFKLLLTEKQYKKGIEREKSWCRNAFSFFWFKPFVINSLEADSTRGTCGRTHSSKLVPRDTWAIIHSMKIKILANACCILRTCLATSLMHCPTWKWRGRPFMRGLWQVPLVSHSHSDRETLICCAWDICRPRTKQWPIVSGPSRQGCLFLGPCSRTRTYHLGDQGGLELTDKAPSGPRSVVSHMDSQNWFRSRWRAW